MFPNFDFEGVVNLRDIGPLTLDNGARLRSGTVFRSETPQLMTEADVERALGELGITRVVDLRGARGGGSGPLGADGRSVVIDFFGIAGGLGEGEAGSADGFLPALIDRAAPVLVPWFEVLVDNPGATLVHCHTGKDRTGFTVAMTLALCGASDSDIVADYERSIPIFETMMANLRASGRGVPADAPPYAQEPPSSSGIRQLLARLRSGWPTPTEYLVDQGLDPDLLAAVRARLVAAP